ncbi:hypothetical protein SIN8267_01306 [Sinobacterium norvegicum]|uniref:Leucine-rich repeat domain-containing protein n=1 Tax=Sinobacterium norvegicum TaxID=1641715 RepID=A0ABM9ADX6_9GAMM|nr:leucine-rich repeat domain-containing protein [Sinobacterium norvegicum]CAH0991204.1 hypothetical protein SIN8267_01306 [Sinobacterium norvegicum]
MKTYNKILTAAILSAALSACGGGGGSSNSSAGAAGADDPADTPSNPPAVTPVEDLMAPANVVAAAGDSIIRISWDEVAQANAYTVVITSDVGQTTTSCVATNSYAPVVVNGESYSITVQAALLDGVECTNEGEASAAQKAEPSEIALSSLSFNDVALQNCVLDQASYLDVTTVSELDELDCGSFNITDLTGIGQLTGLTKHLFLFDNEIASLQPLLELIPGRLEQLDLESYNSTQDEGDDAAGDISALAGFEFNGEAGKLFLANNQIVDASPLAGNLTIAMLEVSGNNITSLDDIAKIPHLTALSIWENGLSDLSGLEAAVKLEYLEIDGNNVTEVESLAKLVKLTELYITDNNLRDVSSLTVLTELTQLDLDQNPNLDCDSVDIVVAALTEATIYAEACVPT